MVVQDSNVDQDSQIRQIEALVEKLGHANFFSREQAEKDLIEIGGPAVSALEKAELSYDSEIRFRARRLLKIIRKADFEFRLKSFLNGESRPDNFGLLGWERFEQLVGDSQKNRELFVAMYRGRNELFQSLTKNSESTQQKFDQLIPRVSVSSRKGFVPDLAAVLFFAQLEFASKENNSRPVRLALKPDKINRLGNVLSSQLAATYIHAQGYQQALKILITSWVKNLPTDDTYLTAKLNIIEVFELKQLVSMAVDVLPKSELTSRTRAQAIKIIANNGTKKDIDVLEQLLDDPQTLGRYPDVLDSKRTIEVQIRDLALAGCIFLSGQKFEDFGFVPAIEKESGFIKTNSAGFFSEISRLQALRKWSNYRQKSRNIETKPSIGG